MSFLADRSPIFRDMFLIPQPPPSTATTEADSVAPRVVELPDCTEDVYDLLRVLVPAGAASRPFSSHIIPTFDTISACIRLGHKCQIDDIVEAGVGYLRDFFPRSLDAYREIVSPAGPPAFERVHAIGVVNLARLTGASEVLPTAIMKCASLPGSQLIAGFRRRDGTHETLSEHDLALCVDAQRALMREHVWHAIELSAPFDNANCVDRARGSSSGTRLCVHVAKLVAAERAGEATAANVFEERDWPREGAGDPGVGARGGGSRLCASCVEVLRRMEARCMQDTWNRLPEIVGVPLKGWGRKSLEGV
ncbi:hypothetical protein BD311DRAFT_663539 [Dichomitus squalens]|uniref:BTB domain-containing protein n=1 Tax=Dichomitus squalens TaxID=114155 RepID=A0A4Q9MPP2_9APHY|nr:hypothetical protein BD311DRAFT_663539 [Dichomitus squalens]